MTAAETACHSRGTTYGAGGLRSRIQRTSGPRIDLGCHAFPSTHAPLGSRPPRLAESKGGAFGRSGYRATRRTQGCAGSGGRMSPCSSPSCARTRRACIGSDPDCNLKACGGLWPGNEPAPGELLHARAYGSCPPRAKASGWRFNTHVSVVAGSVCLLAECGECGGRGVVDPVPACGSDTWSIRKDDRSDLAHERRYVSALDVARRHHTPLLSNVARQSRARRHQYRSPFRDERSRSVVCRVQTTPRVPRPDALVSARSTTSSTHCPS